MSSESVDDGEEQPAEEVARLTFCVSSLLKSLQEHGHVRKHVSTTTSLLSVPLSGVFLAAESSSSRVGTPTASGHHKSVVMLHFYICTSPLPCTIYFTLRSGPIESSHIDRHGPFSISTRARQGTLDERNIVS